MISRSDLAEISRLNHPEENQGKALVRGAVFQKGVEKGAVMV